MGRVPRRIAHMLRHGLTVRQERLEIEHRRRWSIYREYSALNLSRRALYTVESWLTITLACFSREEVDSEQERKFPSIF